LGQQHTKHSEGPTVTEPVGWSLPRWQVVTRRWLAVAIERALGDCFQLSPRAALLVLGSITALLVVIALTLSIGNALLVAGVGVVMRVACEPRMVRR
jgi:hypothetical protein